MAGYTLERAELGDAWDAFVKSSPNGTLFSYSAYLEAIGLPVGLWLCTKGEQVKAAFAVVEPEPWKATLDDLVAYNGLMHQVPEPDQNVSQVRSERFKVAEFVAGELARHYHSLEFQLHPSVVDVRPWLWVHYGLDALKHYRVDVRYTSHFLTGFGDDFALTRMSQSRRQQILYARRDGVTTEEGISWDNFSCWYLQALARQGKVVSVYFMIRLRWLWNRLWPTRLMRGFTSYSEGGESGSIAIFGIDDRRAYWLWGANNPELRDAHTGTAVVWDGMVRLAEDGVQEVDLEGCNSPSRGWFKLSFGGTLTPYYGVSYGLG